MKKPVYSIFVLGILTLALAFGLSHSLTRLHPVQAASSSLNFLQSPPVINSISPGTTPRGQTPAKITIKGSGFQANSTVFFNTTPVTAKIKNDTKIVIKGAPDSLFQNDISYDINVVSPSGQTSNTIKFIVGAGSPQATPTSVTITSPKSFTVNTGGTTTLQVSVLDQNGQPIPGAPVTFSSDNTAIANVSTAGVVTGTARGSATITVSAGQNITAMATFAVNDVTTETSGIFGNSDLEVQGATGNFFASDFQKHVLRIRRPLQSMSDFSGRSGTSGNSDGTATAALFNAPLGVGIGGQVYLADTNNQSVRRINPGTGDVRTVVSLSDIQAVAASVTSWGPRDVAIDSNEDLYISDAVNHVIWQATVNKNSTTVRLLAGGLGQSGTQDGTAATARFNTPQKITLSDTILNVTENSAFVRQIAVGSGTVKSISQSSGVAEPTVNVKFGGIQPQTEEEPFQNARPSAIAQDRAGNLYIAAAGTVFIVTVNGDKITTTELTPPGTIQNPVGIAVTDNSVFVLDGATGQFFQFRTASPTITSIGPNQVATGSTGTPVVLMGTNFLDNTQIFVGRNQIRDVRVVNSRLITFTLPPQQFAGTLTISAITRGGLATTNLTVTGQAATPSIALSAFPSNRTVPQGEDARYTISIDRQANQAPVNLSVSGLPTGATAQFTPNPTLLSGTLLTVSVGDTTPAGNYNLTVTGSAPNISVTPTPLTLTVTAPGIVILSTSPSDLQTVAPGQNLTYTINLNRTSAPGPVNISVSGLPSGATATFSTNPVSGNSTQLTIATTTSTPEGTFTITLIGSLPGALVRATQFVITVKAGGNGGNPSVSLSASPTSITVPAGNTANYVVSLARTNFTGFVTLRLKTTSASAPGITFAYAPSVTAGNESTLSVFTSASQTTPGTYKLIASGIATGATVVDSSEFLLVVTDPPPPPVVTLSVTPSTRTIQAGQSASYTVVLDVKNAPGANLQVDVQGDIPPATTFSFSPSGCSSFPCTSTLTFRTSAALVNEPATATPAGTYNMKLVAFLNGSLAAQADFSLTIQPSSPPSVTLSMSPTSRTVTQGQSTSYTVSVAASNFSGSLSIGISGSIPAGTSFAFNPSSFPIPGSTQLVVTTSASTPAGTYQFQLTGTSSPAISITPVPFTLIVQSSGPGTVTLSMSPTSRTVVRGQSTSYTVSVAASNFSGSLSIGISGSIPAGSSFSFNPSSFPIPGSTQLVVTTSSNTPPGTYSLQLTGTSTPATSITPVPFTLIVQ
ncbi:MAG: Ig-like domain-containing protein [Blastocatellia bacterium]|nr:Ig-like domain-containing protein [Blastocatellia bacterium]